MKIAFKLITLAGLLLSSGTQGLLAQQSASEIISLMESKQRGNTSQARMSITVKKTRFEREMVLDAWDDRKNNKFFIKIIKPKKDQGINFLKIENNMWQYIPKLGKEIKIEGSLMQDSWMGSDFSNDDLVKSSSIEVDYTHKFGPHTNSNEYHIILTPKPDAAIVWSRVEAKILKTDLLPIVYEFYDHKGRLGKRQRFSEYKLMSGRKIPTVLDMETIKNGRVISQTILKFISVKFDLQINPRIFSRSNLRK